MADVAVRAGYKLLKEIKKAESLFRRLVNEINVLSGLLHCLQNLAEELKEAELNVDPKAEIHHIESCLQILNKVKALFDSVLCGPSLSLPQRVKWASSKRAYVNELLVEIERLKATMILGTSAQQM
jgi:hypothetical protein